MKIIALLAALLLCSGTPSPADDLPQDCAIVASVAYVRIAPIAYWCRMLFIEALVSSPLPRSAGHVLVAWQMSEGGPIFAYDAGGTYCFEKIHEQDAEKVACELIQNHKELTLVKAWFVKP